MKTVMASSIFVAVTNADLALTWRDCGGIAKIDKVSPSSVPLGVKTTLTGSGTTPVKVTGGRFDATVKAGWIPLASCSGPLGPATTCNLPLGAGSLTLDPIPLPIGPGSATLSLSVELAASLPAQLAATTTHATAMNTANQKIVCLDVYLKNGEIATVSDTSGSIADDIAKMVCGLMKNGDNEVAAENIICGHMEPLLVGVCKSLVKFDWNIYSKLLKCDAEGHSETTGVYAEKGMTEEIAPVSDTSGDIVDDILKMVCALMKNGDNEVAAENIICGHMDPLLVGVCKSLVKFDWGIYSKLAKCDSEVHHASVVV